MRNYIIKPLSIKKSDFRKKKSLSPHSYRNISYLNQNIVYVEELLSENIKGTEVGSLNYIKFSDNYFIRIGDMDDSDFTIRETSKTLKVKPLKKLSTILKKGDICYQTASNVGNVCFYIGEKAYFNSHIKKLTFARDKYYIFAFLKSNFCKNQVDMGGSIKGVDNFSNKYLLNTRISFPTNKQNKNPKDIELLVSVITQNIIDKEEQTQIKNRMIDEEIEREILDNQITNTYQYKYPKISELIREKRLDTGLYSEKYHAYEQNIKKYKNGYFYLEEKSIFPGRTPPDYYFSDTKKNNKFYDWITPKNINGRELSYHTYIYTNTITKIKKYSLVMNGIRYVGNGIFVDNQTFYANQNMLIINQFREKEKQLFLFCFLTSKIGKEMQIVRRNFGIVPILYSESLAKIPIPKFSKDKQKEVSKKYYNEINRVENIVLDNYLEKNKQRNKLLGIFQLNMEIFELKNQLEEIIDKIVMDEKIEIEKYL